MDPEELDFEFDRSIRFLDMESSFSVISEPSIVRREYLAEVKSYLERMKQGCREFHVDYRFVKTSDPYDKVLTNFLLERQR